MEILFLKCSYEQFSLCVDGDLLLLGHGSIDS